MWEFKRNRSSTWILVLINIPQDKYEVRWLFIENKCLKFSEGLVINDFKASPRWISATFKRKKKVGINLHGEANDMTDEER